MIAPRTPSPWSGWLSRRRGSSLPTSPPPTCCTNGTKVRLHTRTNITPGCSSRRRRFSVFLPIAQLANQLFFRNKLPGQVVTAHRDSLNFLFTNMGKRIHSSHNINILTGRRTKTPRSVPVPASCFLRHDGTASNLGHPPQSPFHTADGWGYTTIHQFPSPPLAAYCRQKGCISQSG